MRERSERTGRTFGSQRDLKSIESGAGDEDGDCASARVQRVSFILEWPDVLARSAMPKAKRRTKAKPKQEKRDFPQIALAVVHTATGPKLKVKRS